MAKKRKVGNLDGIGLAFELLRLKADKQEVAIRRKSFKQVPTEMSPDTLALMREIILDSQVIRALVAGSEKSVLFRDAIPVTDRAVKAWLELCGLGDVKLHVLFDPGWYRRTYSIPENVNTLAHYLTQGFRLGFEPSQIFDSRFVTEQCRIENSDSPISVPALIEYIRLKDRVKISCHRLIDPEWYLGTHIDVGMAGVDAVYHYLTWGWQEGRDPSPEFSIKNYKSTGGKNGVEPIADYEECGCLDGVEPFPGFRAEQYSELFGIASSCKALAHFSGLRTRRFSRTKAMSSPTPQEPGIVPPPLATRALPSGASVLAASQLLARVVPKPGFEQLHLFKKLDGDLGGLFRSEAAALISIEGQYPLSDLFKFVGLLPSYVPHDLVASEFTIPILEAYRAEQRSAWERFKLTDREVGFQTGPTFFSVLLPTYKTPLAFLERAILSVVCQTYDRWELLIVDDCSNDDGIRDLLDGYAAKYSNVRVFYLNQNSGISNATNMAICQAEGDYVALLDHDDMLSKDALHTMAVYISEYPDVDMLYSDECTIDVYDVPVSIFAKPDWSPTLLTACMYTGHLTVYKRDTVNRVGNFRTDFDLSQDYDLALRVTEKDAVVVHVKKILYGWRMIPGSAAQGGKPEARLTNVAALQDYADRNQLAGTAIALPTCNRIKVDSLVDGIAMSVVIPSDSYSNIVETIASIIAVTIASNIEIIVVSNSQVVGDCKIVISSQIVRYVPYDKPYNFSDKCNQGAAVAFGQYVTFLNDDVRPITPSWVTDLIEPFSMPGVGVVGPKLLYENMTIQHAGMVTGTRRLVGTAFHTFPRDSGAHFNLAQSQREVSLICGACLTMSKSEFMRLGGFDAVNTPIAHSDVDLCFRVREAGFSCVYTPHAEMIHIGHLSIGETEKTRKEVKVDKSDIYLIKRFANYVSYDPYFTPLMKKLVYIDSQQEFNLYPASASISRSCERGDVLIVSHDLSGSGAPRVVYDLARTLVQAGYFVVVVSPVDGPYREKLVDASISVVVDENFLMMDDASTSFARNFDIVICNTVVTWQAALTLATVTKVFWYVHETELVRNYLENVAGFSKAIDCLALDIWCGSERSALEFRQVGRAVHIFPYGVEDNVLGQSVSGERSKQVDYASRSLVIGMLATIEPRKGQDLAVKGFLELPAETVSRFKLVVAGRINDPSFASSIRSLAEKCDQIEFRQELSFEQYSYLIDECDIVICPSRDDTLPLVSLDALRLGKVLICSTTVGTSEYITDSVSGFVLSENTPSCISGAFQAIDLRRSEMPQVSEQARRVYDTNFTPERFRSNLLERLGVSLED